MKNNDLRLLFTIILNSRLSNGDQKLRSTATTRHSGASLRGPAGIHCRGFTKSAGRSLVYSLGGVEMDAPSAAGMTGDCFGSNSAADLHFLSVCFL